MGSGDIEFRDVTLLMDHQMEERKEHGIQLSRRVLKGVILNDCQHHADIYLRHLVP